MSGPSAGGRLPLPRFQGVLLLSAVVILTACGGGAPAATPSPPTPAPPTSAPPATPAATPAPTAAPTVAPTVTPASAATASPARPTSAAPSLSAVDLLVSLAHPDLQSTCHERDQIYDEEVASITCGPEDLPFDYSLFSSLPAMAAAYNRDLSRGETPPQPDGTCVEANYEAVYQVGGADAGRVNCRQHHSTSSGQLYHVIEWTNDSLLVIGYISNRADLRSWDDLYAFWQEQAGPFAP